MPKLQTVHLGEVSFLENDIFEFPSGLPGFPAQRRFVLIPDARSPLVLYLQSVDSPDLRFILVPSAAVDRNYRVSLEPCDKEILFPVDASTEGDDLLSFFILSIAPGAEPTVNMLAPVVFRPALRCAVQAVRSDVMYSHSAPLTLSGSLSEGSRPC